MFFVASGFPFPQFVTSVHKQGFSARANDVILQTTDSSHTHGRVFSLIWSLDGQHVLTVARSFRTLPIPTYSIPIDPHFIPNPIDLTITMRVALSILALSGLSASVAAFSPVSSRTASLSTTAPLSALPKDSSSDIGTFDPLNLADLEISEDANASGNGKALSVAAATTAAWVASSEVAGAAGPDWGIFEGVSYGHTQMMRVVQDVFTCVCIGHMTCVPSVCAINRMLVGTSFDTAKDWRKNVHVWKFGGIYQKNYQKHMMIFQYVFSSFVLLSDSLFLLSFLTTGVGLSHCVLESHNL